MSLSGLSKGSGPWRAHLHSPSFPADRERDEDNYSTRIATSRSAFSWGGTGHCANFPETVRHGFVDRFPKTKIVVGHMGEMIPFQLERIIPVADT
ncbi:hypothetical protein BDV18DRAFT_90190 [Aspergillus unguis]